MSEVTKILREIRDLRGLALNHDRALEILSVLDEGQQILIDLFLESCAQAMWRSFVGYTTAPSRMTLKVRLVTDAGLATVKCVRK